MALPQQYLQEQSNPALDALLNKDLYTEAEYFAFEECTPGRWEFIPDRNNINLGKIRAMSGGSSDHAVIAMNLGVAVTLALRTAGNAMCSVAGSDLKIHAADGINSYPDLSIICSNFEYHQGRNDIVTNPILIAEVLSPSTADYDHGGKWQSYQTISTLQHYILISTDRTRVELYTRQEHGWHFETFEGVDVNIDLSALGITLALSDLYNRINLAP